MSDLRLSYAFNPGLGQYVAIVTDKHPADGDRDVNVLATGFLGSEARCQEWFEEMKEKRPWESGGRTVTGLRFLER